MKWASQDLFALQPLISKHRGVFTIYDLANLFLTNNPVEIQQKLRPFLQAGVLNRFCRGFYVAKELDLEWLSQRICPSSALSFGSVPSKEMVIGSIPKKTVYAVKMGKSRIYKSTFGQVVHLGFASPKEAKKIWFGYDIWKDGVRYADKEKAFLDTLYFYQKGHKFSFNIYSDIQVDRLDKKVLKNYLSHYKNPKFRKFVEGVLYG